MISRFNYLLDKINHANFSSSPFNHVTINNFFNEDDFNELINLGQIKLGACENTKSLINLLRNEMYEPIFFPGSITSESKYLKYIENGLFNKKLIDGYGKKLLEGYGITYRLKQYRSNFIKELMEFFEGEELHNLLRVKFKLQLPTYYDGGVQKNLRGYQISPHADTSKKALTWMVNIYTDEDDVSVKEMHTHLCKFKDKYSYVYEVWRNNNIDPVWVPWGWADTVKQTNSNNSITIFKPSFDTLHAVKVSEDHLINQRNQIYGNLWYETPQKKDSMPWETLDLFRRKSFMERIAFRINNLEH